MTAFEATTDFSAAMIEVDLLVQQSAANDANPSAQNAFNKGAILLLAAKMESFLEQIIEEFCYQVSSMALACERLPRQVRLHASRRMLTADFLMALDRCDEEKVLPTMEALALLWHEGCTPTEVTVDSSFSYGKHGEKEIRRLFQRIGVADIFKTCMILDDQELFDTSDQEAAYPVTADVNALTGYRNYIIHSDGTPSVTHVQIERYKIRLLRFSEKVDQHLHQMKESIEAAPTTE